MPYIIELFDDPEWYRTRRTGYDGEPVSLEQAKRDLREAKRQCPKVKYRITEVAE